MKTNTIQFASNSLLTVVKFMICCLVGNIFLLTIAAIARYFAQIELFSQQFINQLLVISKLGCVALGIVTILMSVFMFWEIKSK